MDLCSAPLFVFVQEEDLLMVFWLTILEILKLGLLLDVPIYLLLAGLLPATDGFYFSRNGSGEGPSFLLWGTLLHVLCTWGGYGGAAPKYSGCTIPGLPALSAALTVLLGAGPVVTPLPIPLARLLFACSTEPLPWPCCCSGA